MVETGPKARESRGGREVTRGGGIPGTPAGQAAFSFTRLDPAPVPVLLAVPHAGRVYPAAFAQNMRDQAAACLRLEDRLADLVMKVAGLRQIG